MDLLYFFLFFGNLVPSLFNNVLSDPELWEFNTPQVLSQLLPLAVDAVFGLTRLFQEGSNQLKDPDKN